MNPPKHLGDVCISVFHRAHLWQLLVAIHHPGLGTPFLLIMIFYKLLNHPSQLAGQNVQINKKEKTFKSQ